MADGRRQRRGFGREELQQELAAGRRVPFYLLHGSEEYQREGTCDWLIDALAPPAARAFNLDVFRGDAFSVERFVEVYQSYPLMAGHRLLVLKECDRLSVEQCRSLETVLENPAETSVLIATGDKVDLRRRLFVLLSQHGRALEFRIPYDREVPAWVQQYARSHGLQLEAEAADLLRLYVGANLRELASEVDKLAIYAGQGARISRHTVEQVVGLAPNASAFNLADAIGRQDLQAAAGLVHLLLEQGEEPGRALGLINRHLQLLLKIQGLAGRRLSRNQLAAQLGVSPFFLGGYLEQARRYPRHALWEGLAHLREADARLKSRGRRQEGLVMDLLVHQLCAGGRTAQG